MATTVSGRAYAQGLAKQAALGTAVPPSSTVGLWPKWENGTNTQPQSRTKKYNEGDSSAFQSLNIKTGQWGMGKFVTYARPKEAAMLLTALSGPGSDVLGPAPVAPATNTTHTITRTVPGALDLYTIAANVSTNYYRQMVDAVCSKVVISASKEDPLLKLEADWLGLTNSQGTTLATTSVLTDLPFGYFGGTWIAPVASLNGQVTGFTCTIDNGISPENYIGETVTPNPFSGTITLVTLELDVFWTDGGAAAAAYFNNGTTDSPLLPTSPFSAQFACQSDPTQTFKLSLPNVSFDSTVLTPATEGAPMPEKLTLQAVKVGATAPYQVTANLPVATAY